MEGNTISESEEANNLSAIMKEITAEGRIATPKELEEIGKELLSSEYTGRKVLCYPSNKVIIGNWKNGLRHGIITVYLPNRLVMEEYWQDGKLLKIIGMYNFDDNSC